MNTMINSRLPVMDEETTPTLPTCLGEAMALVLKVEEEGHPSELADWLAHHPDMAGDLADFLAGQRHIRQSASAGLSHHGYGGPNVSGLEIQEEIGRGGMGVVYRAFDRILKRTVAVKCVLTSQLTCEKDLARFRFEAESAARLDHPAIVPVHSFGEIDGQPFLVMKLMEGGSLASLLRGLTPGQLLPPQEAARLVRDIALGVQHAHDRGLLHRDLKPANILLDAEGVPHVADFGLAIALQNTASVHQSGSMAGTASYMAPEQVNGDCGLTTSVDIHALGAILYELLAGQPPFGRDEWLVTIQRVRDDPAPSLVRFRPNLPKDLETICLRCLEKEPRDRYPSAMHLAEDLNRFIEGDPVMAHRRGHISDVAKALARRRNTESMTSWPGFFMAAKSLLITQAMVQAVVLSNISPWWAYAALGLHFAGWICLYWWFLVKRAHDVSPVERISSGLQLGNMLACFSLVPAHIAMHGSNLLPIYPPLTTVFGLSIFAHGATHWGRLYVVGTYLMAVAAMLPLVPMNYWPTAHGLLHAAALVWMGFRHRQFNMESQVIAKTRPGASRLTGT
jgi:serine/threonine-protein kinase